jgi:hypothetical protein
VLSGIFALDTSVEVALEPAKLDEGIGPGSLVGSGEPNARNRTDL